jgi:hypothetical protein
MLTLITEFPQFARDAGTTNANQSELPAGNVLPLIVVDAPQVAEKQNVAASADLGKLSAVSGLDVPPLCEHNGEIGGVLVFPEFAELPEAPEPEEALEPLGAVIEPPSFLPRGKRVTMVPEGLLPSSETCLFLRFA